MDINKDWDGIESIFNECIRASKHAAIATVSETGVPTITPIGFTFLNSNKTAHYFEQYSESLPENLKHNQNVCLMVVNSGTLFWARSLLKGKFLSYPGLRLYGVAGDRRKASSDEIARLKARIGHAKYLKGSNLIWSGLETVRDIQIKSVRPIKYPKMMEHLIADLTQ